MLSFRFERLDQRPFSSVLWHRYALTDRCFECGKLVPGVGIELHRELPYDFNQPQPRRDGEPYQPDLGRGAMEGIVLHYECAIIMWARLTEDISLMEKSLGRDVLTERKPEGATG